MRLLAIIDLLVLFLHVAVCAILIGIVLIQGGKGASLSASFGMGAAATAFGARTDSFMTKLTSGAAIAFVITSLSLTFLAPRIGALTQRIDVAAPPPVAPREEPAAENVAPTPTEAPMTEEDAAPQGN